MRKFLTALIVIPLGLVFVTFAVANRHFVTVSFNPFDSADSALSLSLPLFALLIVVAILGVVAGGLATWFGQRHWRKAARRHEADARSARIELADLRASVAAARQGQRQDPQRLPAPSGAGLYGPVGRDKQRATL
ncbi:LapA family protein [Bradyrhizobium sp.]|uniref:LapA family protein n=1 Tax=Bradyrhizobium sp. TaxID=376 RepID=UPI0023A2FD1A|nr:LapA family protein [Bradyrhizobium sp.]MDE2379881.1 LapA family protein [Bradyrhizobium sp.]